MRYIPLSVAMLMGLCTPVLVSSLTYRVLENQERMTSQVMVGSALTLLHLTLQSLVIVVVVVVTNRRRF